jgi:hypothetical protein
VVEAVNVDAVWDIECAEWDKFVCGGVWTADEGVSLYDDENQLAEHLLSLPAGSTAWAHAGGRYDVLWLLDWCRRRGAVPDAQIRLSGSSISALAIKEGPTLRDSCRLIPMSLREACQMFPGARKEQLAMDCICGRACGGYCSIRVDMAGPERRRLKEYLGADIESLRDTLQHLATYAAAHDILLRGTVAGTAWATAQLRCGLPDAEWDWGTYSRARAGYYGGLTAVGQLECDEVERYDRNSAYPAALMLPVPHGAFRALDARGAGLAWGRGKPGIYAARLVVPEQLAPPLPIKLGARLVYPWGVLAGSWARDEIQHAIDGGSRLLGLDGAVAWAEESPLLAPHVERCFELRRQADTGALKTWLKFLANSLTGAFAQDPKQDMVSLGDYADDPSYEQVGRYDWIWRRAVNHISSRAHVHWAATLTARARIELLDQINHAGDDWCYSDTDSVIAARKLTRNVGAELGQWKHEGSATGFRAIAPKVYTYTDEKGARYARAKGIPDAVREWDRISTGGTVQLDRGVKSFLVAARTDTLFAQNDGHRALKPQSEWIGGRLRDGTRTRAPSVKDLSRLPN